MNKSEIIPDDNYLFRRVHKKLYDPKKRKFTEPAFMVREEKREKSLSVNWDKYESAEQNSYDTNK